MRRIAIKWRNSLLFMMFVIGFVLSVVYFRNRFKSKRNHGLGLTTGSRITIARQPVHNFFYVREQDLFVSPKQAVKNESVPAKLILVYGNSAGFFSEQFGDQNLGGCGELSCTVSSDISLLTKADAVIFHMIGLGDLPKERYTWQRYIFFILESPANYPMKHWDDKSYFNWTMTYRTDSDIMCPYGYTMKRHEPIKVDLSDVIARKRKPIAWCVSNCGGVSQRQRYVEELAHYIPIDIYGACGNLTCPKGPACEEMLNNDYYFYLAFENSICKDYVSEKFWLRGAPGKLVQVVLKRSIVAPLAPANSFIAADDFANPKELADHLKMLIANPDKYEAMLKWQEEFQIVFLNGTYHDLYERPFGFCEICRKLWDPAESNNHKMYTKLSSWWETESNCDADLVERLVKGTSVP